MTVQRKLLFFLVAVTFIGAGGTAVWYFENHREKNIDVLTLYGNVDIRQAELAFNASERIDKMLVKEGEQVNKGQLLAILDTVRLAHNVDLQQAQFASQQQVVSRLVSGSRPQEIMKAQADVEASRIDAENAMHNYQRMQELVSKHFVSQQQVDDSHAAADAAAAKYQSLQETFKLVKIGPRKEDIAAAKAILKANMALVELARKAFADASLYAPENGIIQDRLLEPGDMASPQRPVFTLALTDPIWVRAYVQGSDLGKIKPGFSAEVSTDSFPGRSYSGWVGYISPTSEFTPKSVETTEVRSSLVYQVRIFVCNPNNELRLGMPATITIPLGQAQESTDINCQSH